MRHPRDKFVSLGGLNTLCREYQRRAVHLVATNGCFDLLHAGHVDYLEQCASFGDVLIVGVNSDQSVKALKGDKRPFVSAHDRVRLLTNLQCVDHVCVYDDTTAVNFLKTVRPNYWCKGGDYTVDTLNQDEVAAVKEGHGTIHIFKATEGLSTTALVKKIAETEQHAWLSGLEVLARRAYPDLESTGICSRHQGDGHYDCSICYPAWDKLLEAHMGVQNTLYNDLLALSGLSDPPNGCIGTNAIVAELRRKLNRS